MKILGISAFFHDSAAAILDNGKIIAAAQEERFSRIKHDSAFPTEAIKFCLNFSKIELDQIDAVVFYDKPLLKFERLLDTYYAFSPKGLFSFIASMPVWLKEKLFIKRVIRQALKRIGTSDPKKLKLLFPEHHLSHSASAFYTSPYNESAIITIDGVGEWATATISHGLGKDIRVLKELKFPHSPGLLYSAFTYFLGFKVNSGEYKLMGLAPYGNPQSKQVSAYTELIKQHLVKISDDGSIWINQDYFNYCTGLTMVDEVKWQKIFGFGKKNPGDKLEQHHCDFALAAQNIIEEIVVKMASEAKRLTNCSNLCMAGGVALNCVANSRILELGIFENIFVQPAAGDSGGAIGAAYAAYHIYFNQERRIEKDGDNMQGSYLGPEFSGKEIEETATKFNATFNQYNHFSDLTEIISNKISEGAVVGWFQGRMEFGPRALGNRSILADARNAEMQKKLNLKIKFREGFRPFAPAVLFEKRSDFFEMDWTSPYMLFTYPIKKERRNELPDRYHQFEINDKLYFKRSVLPSVTHIDFSARVQTVHNDTNPEFWKLLTEFHKQTDCPVIINTSFNVRGEPIVCSPEDAYLCFMRTEMDFLVIGNFVFDKKNQPILKEEKDWKKEFVLSD